MTSQLMARASAGGGMLVTDGAVSTILQTSACQVRKEVEIMTRNTKPQASRAAKVQTSPNVHARDQARPVGRRGWCTRHSMSARMADGVATTTDSRLANDAGRV